MLPKSMTRIHLLHREGSVLFNQLLHREGSVSRSKLPHREGGWNHKQSIPFGLINNCGHANDAVLKACVIVRVEIKIIKMSLATLQCSVGTKMFLPSAHAPGYRDLMPLSNLYSNLIPLMENGRGPLLGESIKRRLSATYLNVCASFAGGVESIHLYTPNFPICRLSSHCGLLHLVCAQIVCCSEEIAALVLTALTPVTTAAYANLRSINGI